jgi:ABC-type amino acid transport system permease subunit
VEKVIETLASSLGNAVAWLAEHWVLFGVFAFMWILFAVSLVSNQGSIDEAWQSIRGLPLLAQLLLWLFFLPVMVGLWIWETDWPFLVRIVLVISLAAWNLLVLMPRAPQPVPG